MPSEPLGILLISGEYERVHYAFVVAAGAAALGRRVVVFATNGGCRGLLKDWSGVADASREQRARAAGVAGLHELREATRELGVQMIACEAGLRIEGLNAAQLLAGVEVAGIVTFLSTIGPLGQIMTL